jgi:hypothetical protein
VNKIEIPTYVYMSVDYTEGLDQAAARASYKGVNLRVEYGASRTDHRSYFTGDFVADYEAAIAFVQGFGQAEQVIPFMGSSSVDSYMFDAGYDTEENAADEAALDAWKTEGDEALTPDLPFLPEDQIESVVSIANRLEKAWAVVPADKLQWALANVIASSGYNTSFPGAPLGRDRAMQALTVLDRLMAGQGV